MDFLNSDFILSDEEISILDFDNTPEEKEEKQETKGTKETTEDIDPNSLFSPESVGSEDIKEEKKNPSTTEENSSPNNSDFYYSLTNALVEDGVLSNLDEDFIKTKVLDLF